MIQLRPSSERGIAEHGWLVSRHTFSFARYYDPAFMGFGPLRVINEDLVMPGKGFERHSHADMEIISYVIKGELAHKDSIGNGGILKASELQVMSAGTGISHSEFNASSTQSVHFLQIWIMPNAKGLQPSYQQSGFPKEKRSNQFCLAISPDGESGSLSIHQNVRLYLAAFDAGKQPEFRFDELKIGWLQLISGGLSINGVEMGAGDGAAIRNENQLHLQMRVESEFLFFDLGPG